jgi:hypothetical protein
MPGSSSQYTLNQKESRREGIKQGNQTESTREGPFKTNYYIFAYSQKTSIKKNRPKIQTCY